MKKQLLIIGITLILLAVELSGCEGLFQTDGEDSDENKESEIGIKWFQMENTLPMVQIYPKKSEELIDSNRLGQLVSLQSEVRSNDDVQSFVYKNRKLGLKLIRLTIDYLDWIEVKRTGRYSEHYIDPSHDMAIGDLVEHGIEIMYCLVYWDETIQVDGDNYSRFKTENEIQRYLDYAQFLVQNFKGRIRYYCILNEPNIEKNTQQYVEVNDYISLIRRVVPIIHQEDPEAKIVVGEITSFIEPGAYEYLMSIISSDIMPLVDGVCWHAGGTSPEYQADDYYNYSSKVEEIKDVASSNGFNGEYFAEELHWRTSKDPHPTEYSEYSEKTSAKYYARGTIINLGMNLTTGFALESLEELPLMVGVIRNLCTIMEGAEPVSLSLEIQSQATNIRNYSFTLPNDDLLVALWIDDAAVDEDLGTNATLTFLGLTAQNITGIDVLKSYQQPIIIYNENGNLVIQNLIVRDYPLILRIVKFNQ